VNRPWRFESGRAARRAGQACEIHNERETEYLIGTPLLADYLEEALDALGYSPEDSPWSNGTAIYGEDQ